MCINEFNFVFADNREREEILAEINSLLEEGDSDAAKKKAPHCAHITQELLLILLEELIKAKVDYIIAPNTANAQIAYLVREGYANFAMTEDSELILYNVRYILYKYVPAQCAGVLFDAQKLADCFVNDKDNYEYSFDSFRRLCILVGCEFLDNLKGISYNKAKKFIASVSDRDWNADLLLDMPRILSSKALVVPHEYVDKFRQVELAYDYQLVFDPKQRKLVHMNPVPSSMKSQVKQFSGLSSLTGSKLIDWVLGTLDYETLEPLSSHAHLRELAEEHLFNQEDSIWNPKCPPATVKKFQAAKTKGDVDEVAQVEKEANLAAVKRAKKEAKEQKAKAKKQKSDNSTGKGSRKSNESGKKSSKSREKVGGDSKKKKK